MLQNTAFVSHAQHFANIFRRVRRAVLAPPPEHQAPPFVPHALLAKLSQRRHKQRARFAQRFDRGTSFFSCSHTLLPFLLGKPNVHVCHLCSRLKVF